MIDVNALRDLLRTMVSGDAPQEAGRLGDPRLAAAISGLSGGSSGPGDVASLMRTALRHRAVKTGHPALALPLEVPMVAPWPDQATWEAHGFQVGRGRGSYVLSDVRAWRPTWGVTVGNDADSFAAGASSRRVHDPRPADPYWRHATAFPTYV